MTHYDNFEIYIQENNQEKLLHYIEHYQATLIADDLRGLLMLSVRYDALWLISYVLNYPDDNLRPSITIDDNLPFRIAVQNNLLASVKHLLTSPELKEHADIRVQYNFALRHACLTGNIELGVYVLSAPELKEHASWAYLGDMLIWMYSKKHYHAIKTFFTIPTDDYLDFESTNYSLSWFLSLEYHPGHEEVIEGLALSLKRYNYLAYLDYVPAIEAYAAQLQDTTWRERVIHGSMEGSVILNETAIML